MVISRIISAAAGLLAPLGLAKAENQPQPPLAASFYEMTARAIDGKEVALSRFKGKVALVVNTASKCGYTPQYRGLEALYKKYSAQGFVVLGFPSNDFGRQEPGSGEEIKKFCELNYRVTFPLFEKAPVKGRQKQEVYRFLTGSAVGVKDGEIGWNFVKFLIDKNGRVAERFTTRVEPLSPKVTSKIEELLK